MYHGVSQINDIIKVIIDKANKGDKKAKETLEKMDKGESFEILGVKYKRSPM